MLQYGFTGLGAGLLIGAGGGYLAARDPDWKYDKRNYRALGLGAGIGALSGMALGLGLGAADLGADAPGYGGVVLRDTLYGTGLGAVAGAIGGTRPAARCPRLAPRATHTISWSGWSAARVASDQL